MWVCTCSCVSGVYEVRACPCVNGMCTPGTYTEQRTTLDAVFTLSEMVSLLVTTASQDPPCLLPISLQGHGDYRLALPTVGSEDWSSNLYAHMASVVPTRSSLPCPHCAPPYFLRQVLSPSLELSLSSWSGWPPWESSCLFSQR